MRYLLVDTQTFGGRQRGFGAVQRQLDLAVVDVGARDPTQQPRGSATVPGSEEIEDALVAPARHLTTPFALRPLSFFDERGDSRRQFRPPAHAVCDCVGPGAGGVIFLANVGREMPRSRAAAA